jgi:hypothetical protein
MESSTTSVSLSNLLLRRRFDNVVNDCGLNATALDRRCARKIFPRVRADISRCSSLCAGDDLVYKDLGGGHLRCCSAERALPDARLLGLIALRHHHFAACALHDFFDCVATFADDQTSVLVQNIHCITKRRARNVRDSNKRASNEWREPASTQSYDMHARKQRWFVCAKLTDLRQRQ